MYRPRFVITPQILTNVAQATAAKEIIENAPLVPAWEVRFRQEALVRAVHHGTHIEGNALNFTQAKEILDGRLVEARERDIQEIINYRSVLKFIDSLQERFPQRITEADLLQVHRLITEKILPPEQSGHFRQAPVVVRNIRTKEVSFKPPPFEEVPALVGQFLEWLNSNEAAILHPILRAGITHYELVRIHPFTDGNGRVARAMATLVLFWGDFDVKKFFSLEEYYDRNAASYYQNLQAVSNQKVAPGEQPDLTPWLEYFTTGLVIELERVKKQVLKLSADAKLKNKIGQLRLSERQAKLVEYIQDYGQITNAEWRRLLPDYSDDTILRDLKDLQEKGLVKKKGVTKGAVYVLR